MMMSDRLKILTIGVIGSLIMVMIWIFRG